jgi:hypothetical protein
MNASRHTLNKLLHKFTRSKLSSDDLASLRSALNDMQAKDWQALLSQAELYGISNWLLKHCTEHGLAVPKSVLLSLKALSMRHRAAANARYQVMQALLEKFAEHDLPLIALKGLALAPMIYPSDELRPMRDLDVLVPLDKEQLAATLVREMGFDLPESQDSKFMRNSHQLPNATKTVNGLIISLEIHHDALSRDVPDSLVYEDVKNNLQTIKWRDLDIVTLDHEFMLHQVCRHLEGTHSGALLKLINVLDVVLYGEHYIDEINWPLIKERHPHVINTLKCVHLIVPLSSALSVKVGGVSDVNLSGVGEIMRSLTYIGTGQNTLVKKFSLLFNPSDWWLHLYYNVDPCNSLFLVKTVRHPVTIVSWLGQRLYSRLLGG